MKTYGDASLLVAAIAEEPRSDRVRAFLAEIGGSGLVVSAWVGTEVASALTMKLRQGVLTEAQRDGLLRTWRIVAAAATRLPVEWEDFALAETLVNSGRRGLRAGDALHVAIASRAGLALATLDRDMADAADALGIEVAFRPTA